MAVSFCVCLSPLLEVSSAGTLRARVSNKLAKFVRDYNTMSKHPNSQNRAYLNNNDRTKAIFTSPLDGNQIKIRTKLVDSLLGGGDIS